MASRRNSDSSELDLVPIMNLVTILIPFLLMSSHFVSMAALDVSQPAIGEKEPIDEPEVERLSLKIVITADGFVVASDEQEIGEDGELSVELEDDTNALNELLTQIKRDWPGEEMVVLVPDPNTSYDRIIQTMDAARSDGNGDLFPNVIVAGGAQ